MKVLSLKPVTGSVSDYEQIEKQLIRFFKEEIYSPLMKELGGMEKVKYKNNLTPYALLRAIQDGQVTFNRGRFKGRFSAKISKELRSMGAVWEAKTVSFKFPSSKLPLDIKSAISVSDAKLNEVLKRIDKRLASIDLKSLSDGITVEKSINKTLWKTSTEIGYTLKAISVQPKLSDEMMAKISSEYNDNMKRYISEWSEMEIKSLRAKIADHAYSGMRYEGIIGDIQKSYGVSQSKAKFLARQETNLYVTKLKETIYTSAGVPKYKWKTVIGSPGHEVRHSHAILDGKVFRWDSPPVVNEKGDRKNPSEDFGCRCFAIPIVEF